MYKVHQGISISFVQGWNPKCDVKFIVEGKWERVRILVGRETGRKMRLERWHGTDNEKRFMSCHPGRSGEPMEIFDLGNFYS